FFSRRIAVLLGADTSILDMTNTYLYWLMLFAPAFILNDVFLCFVRNDGSPQLPMIAQLTGSLANILLDYIFIFPLGMGIFGAIFATGRSEEHTSELQSRFDLVCRLLLEKTTEKM